MEKNIITEKQMDLIVKLHSTEKNEDVNESILNWDLHQKLMEKKYGKRKIDKTYKYKNFK